MHRDADQIPNLFGSYVFNEEAMSQYVDEAAMNAWRGWRKACGGRGISSGWRRCCPLPP